MNGVKDEKDSKDSKDRGAHQESAVDMSNLGAAISCKHKRAEAAQKAGGTI